MLPNVALKYLAVFSCILMYADVILKVLRNRFLILFTQRFVCAWISDLWIGIENYKKMLWGKKKQHYLFCKTLHI